MGTPASEPYGNRNRRRAESERLHLDRSDRGATPEQVLERKLADTTAQLELAVAAGRQVSRLYRSRVKELEQQLRDAGLRPHKPGPKASSERRDRTR